MYSSIYKNDPDRSNKIAALYAAFPYAKGDQDVRDILAADEKELEKNPHPQEEEQSLDSAELLFLEEQISVRNIDGKMIDLPYGSLVRRLSSKGDTFTVTADGVNAFDVSKDKLSTGRQDVLAMAQQKKREAAELNERGTTMVNTITRQAAQQQQQQQRAEMRRQQGEVEQPRQPEVPQQTIDRQEEILFLLGKVQRPGMSVVLPPPKQQAALWKEYLRLQSSRADLPEQARQQARDDLASIEQEESNKELRQLRARAAAAEWEAEKASRSDR
jgi:hypothetical protein